MPHTPGILVGELGFISLFDLGQLLLLNHATGVLAVTDEGKRATLSFRDGQLVNAIDETRKQGVDAACRILAWKSGRFEFRKETPTEATVIEGGTEAIMMEAARRMDELAEGQNPGLGSATAKLVERQSQFDAIRDEFHRVASDAVADARRAPPWSDAWFDQLQTPDDRLLIRPGAPPRLFTGDAWQSPGDGAPADAEAYQELKSMLLSGGSIDDIGAPTAQRLVRHRRRVFSVTLARGTHESLWISLIPATVDLHGPLDGLDSLMARPSTVVLATAPRLDLAHVLLRALVARFADGRGASVVVVSDDPMLAPIEDRGVVVLAPTAEAETLIHAARPAAVAVDALAALDVHLLAALATVPVVLAAVVASQPEMATPRWLLRFPAAEVSRAQSLIDSSTTAIVLGTVDPAGRLAFALHRVMQGNRVA